MVDGMRRLATPEAVALALPLDPIDQGLVEYGRAAAASERDLGVNAFAGIDKATPLLKKDAATAVERELREAGHRLIAGPVLEWDVCHSHRGGIVVNQLRAAARSDVDSATDCDELDAALR